MSVSNGLSNGLCDGKQLSVITSNNRKTGANVVALVIRLFTSSVKCWTTNFCDLASEGPDKHQASIKI